MDVPFATTRARTPNGRVTSGPRVCPDGNPCTTGPLKSFRRSASTDFADERSAGLIAIDELAEHDRRRAIQHAGEPQLREHSIEPERPLADVFEKQHVAVWAD